MKRIFLLILLIPLVGCAHIGTVKSQMGEAAFQEENLPCRTLSVCVISEGAWPKESIENLISDTSGLLREQVGIQLRIDGWIDHAIPSFTPGQGLQNLVEIAGKKQREYDMVVGFSSRGLPSYLIEMTLGVWLGAIDDDFRKFIIIKYLDKRILMHEICHAFVYKRNHSMNGVMTALLIKVPLVPLIFNLPKYVSTDDRGEMLEHKWRSFNQKPEIPKKYQADRIDVPAD